MGANPCSQVLKTWWEILEGGVICWFMHDFQGTACFWHQHEIFLVMTVSCYNFSSKAAPLNDYEMLKWICKNTCGERHLWGEILSPWHCECQCCMWNCIWPEEPMSCWLQVLSLTVLSVYSFINSTWFSTCHQIEIDVVYCVKGHRRSHHSPKLRN